MVGKPCGETVGFPPVLRLRLLGAGGGKLTNSVAITKGWEGSSNQSSPSQGWTGLSGKEDHATFFLTGLSQAGIDHQAPEAPCYQKVPQQC